MSPVSRHLLVLNRWSTRITQRRAGVCAASNPLYNGKCYRFTPNTHTEASYTGLQTTVLREQARSIIKRAVSANDDHKLIFCGSGATAAIHKLIDMLNLRLPADLAARYSMIEQIPKEERPVVFIGPYEHHSNELPWRESIAELVVIPLNAQGMLNLQALESSLQHYQQRAVKIGSFSAASNVTGVKTDVDAVARLLHRHGALSFWDYAAAAPYVGIDASGNQDQNGDSSLDALFISPHKFIGGPGTPGILIVKSSVLHNSVPAVPGGGTVSFVTPTDHRYLDETERREEGGTPAIVESIRAGLVFKLQQEVGTETIEQLESALVHRAITRWQASPTIEILGSTDAPRLSIVSLQIRHHGKYLHYGFVVALLNDLFGIQARGGCSCAGPYGHQLLGMDMAYSKALETEILAGHMVLRPGWIRLNFNYFIDEPVADYLIRAVELIALHGWRLLPCYQFDEVNGVWRYQNEKTTVAVSLDDFGFEQGEFRTPSTVALDARNFCLLEQLTQAEIELLRADRCDRTFPLVLPESAERLRWFTLPQDIEPT